jgi:predicted RND superfamily exporter protein
MFAVILLGLGVDFSIHIISVYTENRAAGHSIGQSLRLTLLKSGNGIITGGLTTACAFLTLTVSETAGMREFGIVAGSGVIFCMLATILVLPAMLALRDKILIRFRKEKHKTKSTQFDFLGALAVAISRKPVPVLSGGLIVTALLLYSALQITFDYNYLNMEPVGLTSIKLQDEMEEEFDVTPDFVLVTTSSIEEARRITEAAKDLKMIGMVTSISEYVPSADQQRKRIPHIQEIHDSLANNRKLSSLAEDNLQQFYDELYRVEDNVIELAQLAYLGGQDKVDQKCKEIVGDLENTENKTMISLLIDKLDADRTKTVRNLNLFQEHYEPNLRRIAMGMASTASITVDDLPKNIVNRFASHDGEKFLLTIYPKEGVWKNIVFLERFTRQMQKLDERVTGIPSIFYILMGIIAKDGKIAATLTIAVVFLLLLWDFRNLKFTMLAMVPLVVGVVWMVGCMRLFGLQLTMVNVVGIPLILGIGIDDGVHILHRYRVEGAGNIGTVFTSTGKAVMLTSLTTMLAFGSLVFATYRGLGSMGIALFIGVGTCFLTSITILPALLGLLEKKKIRSRT